MYPICGDTPDTPKLQQMLASVGGPLYLRHMPKIPQTLITTAEAAALLGVDASTVQRRARRGLLPTVYKPDTRTGAYVFDRDEIESIARSAAA